MKVILIYLGRNGSLPIYSLEIAKKLEKKITISCIISSDVENSSHWEKEDFSIYQVQTYTNLFSFLISLFNLRRFYFIRQKIKEFSPDVIYYPAFHFWIPIINFLVPKIPKVFTLHDPILHKGENSFLIKALQNLIIRQSKEIIVLSQVFKDFLQQKKKIASEKINVIPHGVLSYYSEISGLQKVKKEKNGDPAILFFGRIIEYKGLNVLLRAFPLIKKEIPKVKLLIAGTGSLSPYNKFLRKLKDVKIEDRWIKDSEVAELFYQSDILVCPYIEASQSGVIPVSYSLKVPVVASNIGGLKEQVDDKITGLLVQPDDPEKLSKACVELLKDKEKRKRMGENGYQKANKEWNWEIISEKVLQVFKKTAKNI